MQHFRDNNILYQVNSQRSDCFGDIGKYITTHGSSQITIEFEDRVRRPYAASSLDRINQEGNLPEAVVVPTHVHAQRILRAHVINEMEMPCPARVQVDRVVAAAAPPRNEGYETGNSNKSLAMEAAINELTIAFTNFLCIANRHQRRHGRQGDAGFQAMNIVRDLQLKE